MVEDTDITLPRVPDSDGPAAFISAPDVDKVIPNTANLALGPDGPALDVLVWGPLVVPAVVGGYLAEGEESLADIETFIRDRAGELEEGKISKFDAYYFPQAPVPPAAWEYRCGTCRFYQSPDETDDGRPKCEVVGEDGDWFGGEGIHPQAWCSLWMPENGRGFLEWATDRLEGVDGAR